MLCSRYFLNLIILEHKNATFMFGEYTTIKTINQQ